MRAGAGNGGRTLLALAVLAFAAPPTAAVQAQDAAAPVEAPAKAPLVARVNVAIDKAAEWLVEQQGEDGGIGTDDPGHPLGRTALCTFALLHAGRDAADPAVAAALARLGLDGTAEHAHMPLSVYEAGCMMLLMHALEDDLSAHMHRIADWLVEKQDASGLWGYPAGTPDLSNAQFAAIALELASRHGHKAPKQTWERLQSAVLSLQASSGAFRYHPTAMYRASMTHAALLCLRFSTARLGRKRPTKEVRTAVRRGLEWLDENYTVTHFPDGRGRAHQYYFFYMYGLERFAVIHGLDEIAGHDWYAEGAEELLARRRKDWSWGTTDDTAFAVLFLRRAALTAPPARARAGDWAADAVPVERRYEAPGKDVPRIRSWLVAGPFAGTPREDDLLFGKEIDVARAKPQDGRRAGGRKLDASWGKRDAAGDDGVLTLPEGKWAVHYCAVWIHAESECDARLWLGSDDGALAYLNGTLVLDAHVHGRSGNDRFHAPVSLRKGANLLVVKVENHTGACSLAARVSAPDGSRLESLRVTTEP